MDVRPRAQRCSAAGRQRTGEPLTAIDTPLAAFVTRPATARLVLVAIQRDPQAHGSWRPTRAHEDTHSHGLVRFED